jgi:hypothetical protein
MGFLSNFFKPDHAEKKQGDRESREDSAAGKKTDPASETFRESGGEKSPEKKSPAGKKGHATVEKQIVLDIATLLPQIPPPCIRADLPADLKKEALFSLEELLPSLAQGKATVPFSRIAALSPEIFTEQQPAEPLEIRLPLAQIVAQAGELPVRPGQTNEKTPSLGVKFSRLVAEKNIPLAAPKPESESKPEQPPAPFIDEEKIFLRLSALLQVIPKGLLRSDAKAVEKSMRVPLPFHFIEAQLGSGKVEFPLADFLRALPDEFKALFVATTNGDSKIKIPIPLAEVLLNLPGTTPLPPVELPSAKISASKTKPQKKAEPPVDTVVEKTDEVPADVAEKKSAQPEPEPAAEKIAPVEIAAKIEAVPEPPKTAEEIPKVEPAEKIEAAVAQPPAEEKPAELPPPPAAIEIAAEEVAAKPPAEIVEEKPVPVEIAAKIEPPPEPEIAAIEVPAVAEPVIAATEVFHPHAIKVEIAQPAAEEKIAAPEPAHAPSEPATFIIETPPDAAHTHLTTILPPMPQLRVLAPLSISATSQEPSQQQAEAAIHPQHAEPVAPQNPFLSNGKLDAVKVAAHAATFDNITAVALSFAEEFQTAGDVPQNLNAQDVCAAARTLFHATESAGVPGRTRHITLQHDTFSSTFFKQGDILLGVVHPHNPLPWEIHGRLATLTEEVARLR